MPGPGDDAVQQVRARIDIVDVVSERVRLSKRGRDLWGLCPFHNEDSPSFHVTPSKQSWYCFACDEGGDVFKFVQKYEKVEFRDALRMLAEKAGIELQKEDPRALEAAHRRRRILELNKLAAQFYEYVLHELPAGEPGRRLLEQRGVSTDTAKIFQLGYAPAGRGFTDYLRKREKPLADAVAAGLARRDGHDFFQERLLVPIRDERGQVLAFTGRTVRTDENRKYVNTPETDAYRKGRVLFALDLARKPIEEAGHAVLMEGQFDVITAHQHGIANAIASSGTALTEDQVRLLKRFTEEVVLVFDSDPAGRTAAFKAVEAASTAGLRSRVVALEGAKDPDEFLRAAGDAAAERWTEAVAKAPAGWEAMLADAIQGLNSSRPREQEIALQRVRAVLARIGDPALRSSYADLAARWLAVDGRLLAGAASPGRPQPASAGPAPARQPRVVPSPDRQLIQVLAARPEIAERVRLGVRQEDLDEDLRETFGKMLEAIDAGGADALQTRVGEFDEWEQNLVRQAWVEPPPGYDDDGVVDALLKRIRTRADQRRRKGIISDLAEAERTGDMERAARLMAEHSQLLKQAYGGTGG